jgi:hypothetical protein
MSKLFLLLGLVGTLIAGVVLGGRLESRECTASVEEKLTPHSCPAIGIKPDFDSKPLPEALLRCDCTEKAVSEKWTPIFPPRAVVDASANGDHLIVSYREFTPPFGGAKKTALSFTLDRGGHRETTVASAAWPVYQSFALFTLAPLGIGLVLSLVAGMLSKKKTA